MTDLSARLLTHIRGTRLLPRPGLAVLAVSGGPDSVALLDLFATIAPDLDLRLMVAHIDHGIAPQSGRVARQILALAERYGIPSAERALALGELASETIARQERYRALRRIQREAAAEYLVTAHHADDQIETVLHRFLRGSGTAGLAGIGAKGAKGLVRPLLPFRRTELAEWLDHRFPTPESRPPIFDDPANRDSRHDRSWLRTQLLPLLRERFGARLDQNLLAGQAHASGDREAWSLLLREMSDLDFRVRESVVDVARAPLRTYDKALSEAVLRAVAREAGCVLGARRSAKLAELAASGSSGRVQELGGGWIAELAFDRVRILRSARPVSPPPFVWGEQDAGSGYWGGWEISWRPEPAGTSSRGGLTAWVSRGSGRVRGAQRGDRVFPLGGVGHRSVHRLLMEARVPRSERSTYPVLVRGSDLLWVPGVCRAAVALPALGEISLRIDARHA